MGLLMITTALLSKFVIYGGLCVGSADPFARL